MEYTAKQFTDAGKKRIGGSPLVGHKNQPVNLNDIEFHEGFSVLINEDLLVISQDRDDWVQTFGVRVRDITSFTLSDADTVKIVTPLKEFKVHTNNSSEKFALALMSVLSPT